jgi:hypothetical protein
MDTGKLDALRVSAVRSSPMGESPADTPLTPSQQRPRCHCQAWRAAPKPSYTLTYVFTSRHS